MYNNPVKKKQKPGNLQTQSKTSISCWAKKAATGSEHGLPEITENHWENTQITSSGPAVETVLLLHPPAGHRQSCKGILVKPMETSFYPGRSVCGPVYDGAPTEHEHG